jgi:predicted alpha/beta-hydrolase family hydrolase
MSARRLRTLLLLGCLLASPARAAEPELTTLSIPVRGKPVSALLLRPADARALLVLAHGQAMDIHHPFMEAVSDALAKHGVATLRFNFPYAEAKRPQLDGQPLLVEAFVAAVNEGEKRRGSLPLLVGGKSVGALIAAEAVRQGAVPGSKGLVILTFPLHAPQRPSALNAPLVSGLKTPVLFVQGTRDPLADVALMTAVVERIGKNASIHVVEDADHLLALPPESARLQAQVYDEVASAVEDFVATLAQSQGG